MIIGDVSARNTGSSGSYEQLQERIETVNERSDRSNRDERFLDIATELADNFEAYGNDLYHGTWGNGIDGILNQGVSGSEDETRITGETGTQGHVSLTSLPGVAFHYSLDQTPQTVATVYEFVADHDDFDLEPVDSVGEQERATLATYIESLPADMNVGPEPENATYTVDILKDQCKQTDGFQDMPYEIDELLVDEAVIGIDYDAIRDQVEEPRDVNELDALDNHSLEEYKADHLPNDAITVYVSHSFLDHYQEQHPDMEIRSYDSLRLRHELEMAEDYRTRGKKAISDYWEGDRLGIGITTEEWDDDPAAIDVTS